MKLTRAMMAGDFPQMVTIGDKYGPAMAITTQADADAYFRRCVKHTMSFGKSRQEAEAVERSNLGYYAGYGTPETRERVERLFKCKHPVFGAIAERGAPTADDAVIAGLRSGSAELRGE